MFKLLISLLVLISLQPESVLADPKETRSVMVGHLYPIMDDAEIVTRLFQKIVNLKPDYVFVLGDSRLYDSNVVKTWRRYFGAKVYFVPGNHEVRNGNLQQFLDTVGYTQLVVDDANVRFLIGNSNGSARSLVDFIEKSSSKAAYKPTLLLVHHRIWDDTLTSASPYQHDKSFYLKDIFHSLEKHVNTIFAGNSKHQYFFDTPSPTGKQNMNNIFWADRIGNINAYSIGTGKGKPKLGFVEVISNSQYPALVIPHHITTGLQDPIPVHKQILDPKSVPPLKYKLMHTFP